MAAQKIKRIRFIQAVHGFNGSQLMSQLTDVEVEFYPYGVAIAIDPKKVPLTNQDVAWEVVVPYTNVFEVLRAAKEIKADGKDKKAA